jgi:hypothetical protein
MRFSNSFFENQTAVTRLLTLRKLGYFQKHDKIEGPSEGAVRFGRSRVINIAQRQTTRQHHQEHAANARKY